jgi:opacity protein-like surface antigen
MLRRSIGFAAALVITAASAAQAQHWETPTFFSPRPHDDLGVYAIKPEGGDWGVVGIWRQSGGINLGVRGGVGGPSGDRTVLVGAELFGPIALNAPPLALYWVTGIGASFNGVTALRIPLGVSVGAPLGTEGGLVITPYVHPRGALDVFAFDNADNEEETDTEFNFDVDLGVDLAITPRFSLKAGYTVGDVSVFGLGAAFRLGRGAAVR